MEGTACMQQADLMLSNLDGLIPLQAQQIPAFKANEYLLQGKTISTVVRPHVALRVPLPPGPIFANKTTERNNF
jgi:hypothetical protein